MFNFFTNVGIIESISFIIVMLISLSFHEFSHAFIAYQLGDMTAKYNDRLTLNPIKHLDPVGTIFFLIVGFGWAKPVPINTYNFQNKKLGIMLVSLAGPLSNLLLALIGHIFLIIFQNEIMMIFFTYLIIINLALMAFNLLPLYPLDGEKIFGYFISESMQYDIQKNSTFILLGLLIMENIFRIRILSGYIFFVVDKFLILFSIWL